MADPILVGVIQSDGSTVMEPLDNQRLVKLSNSPIVTGVPANNAFMVPIVTAAQNGDKMVSLAPPDTIKNKSVLYNSGGQVAEPKFYTGTGNVTSNGNVTFNMTKDGTPTGDPIFAEVYNVQPLVNDSTKAYLYQYTVSPDMRTLTINVKVSTAALVSLVGLSLMGAPVNVPTSTVVSALVTGR